MTSEVKPADLLGGCLCGRVRYKIGGEPTFVAICHCENCQKQTGAPFALLAALPRRAVSIAGQTKTFQDTGDTGAAVHRVFCPACSSPILANPDLKPNVSFVFASTLDDKRTLRPTLQIYCKSAQPWVSLKGLQSFQGLAD